MREIKLSEWKRLRVSHKKLSLEFEEWKMNSKKEMTIEWGGNDKFHYNDKFH
jgi:hypothetical protein